MLRRKTHFPEIPLEAVMKIIERQRSLLPNEREQTNDRQEELDRPARARRKDDNE